MTWFGLLAVVALLVLLIYTFTFLVGRVRWERDSVAQRRRLYSNAAETGDAKIDFSAMRELPAPLGRYLRTVLHDQMPIPIGVRLRHEGSFNTNETEDRWKPFISQQWVRTRPPGFLWNARIAMAPGLPVFVHDAYINGWGILHASILGFFSVAKMEDRSSLAEGELIRYFAETVWYPFALLPGERVTWEPIDDRSAYGRLNDGVNSVTLRFTFNDDGLLESVTSDSRGRTVGGEVVPTPWQGRFWNYRERDGVLVPTTGEVAWLLEDGEIPYWRGELVDLEYQFQD